MKFISQNSSPGKYTVIYSTLNHKGLIKEDLNIILKAFSGHADHHPVGVTLGLHHLPEEHQVVYHHISVCNMQGFTCSLDGGDSTKQENTDNEEIVQFLNEMMQWIQGKDVFVEEDCIFLNFG